MDLSLTAHEVACRIGRQQLLVGVSLTLRPGELLALLGPNGAGKSTLLKLLTGERAPSGGRVTLDGKTLSDWPGRDLARRRAVLPQSTSLAFPFTALEVVLLGRTPHCVGNERDRDQSIAHQALAAADVLHLAERLYTTLSGGERQRVQLARVLAQIWLPPPDGGPRYLLLDEPVAALDPAHQHAILGLARQLTEQGVGVLAVLHDLNLASRYADRVALLDRGSLVICGSPQDVLQAELLQAVFRIPVRVVRLPDSDRPLLASGPP